MTVSYSIQCCNTFQTLNLAGYFNHFFQLFGFSGAQIQHAVDFYPDIALVNQGHDFRRVARLFTSGKQGAMVINSKHRRYQL